MFNASTNELNKPVSLIIPFEHPEDYLLLDNYKYLYRLYQINSLHETDNLENWVVVEDFEIDTVNNYIKANIKNMDCGYCILFKEYNCYNNYILHIEGEINDIHKFVYNGYTDFQQENELYKTFYFSDNYSQYLNISESQDIPYQINFTFNGSNAGNYTGNNVYVKYCNSLDFNQNWKTVYENTDDVTIAITKYGNIGEMTEGSISGTLKSINTSGNTISINMDFIFIRVR